MSWDLIFLYNYRYFKNFVLNTIVIEYDEHDGKDYYFIKYEDR